jgi:aconitate hydratase 2/2-methylisocitrate dehydratase
MVHKGDLKILSQMLKNIDEQYGKLSLKHRLLWRLNTMCVDELNGEIGKFYKSILVSNLTIMLKSVARIGYENILYLERPGCNLCMGNKKKQKKGIQ